MNFRDGGGSVVGDVRMKVRCKKIKVRQEVPGRQYQRKRWLVCMQV